MRLILSKMHLKFMHLDKTLQKPINSTSINKATFLSWNLLAKKVVQKRYSKFLTITSFTHIWYIHLFYIYITNKKVNIYFLCAWFSLFFLASDTVSPYKIYKKLQKTKKQGLCDSIKIFQFLQNQSFLGTVWAHLNLKKSCKFPFFVNY